MKTITNIMYPAFALFAFACVALSPQARATCQDACLTNNNTVHGDDALLNNTTGFDNGANGYQALFSNTTGHQNTANGTFALFGNTSGSYNTANGESTLLSNTTGYDNTGTGDQAMINNTTGFNNTAYGAFAIFENTTGANNTAIGVSALGNSTVGSNNIAVGASAGNLVTENNNIDIGNIGARAESGVIRLGTEGVQLHTFIAGIVTSPITTGTAVGISSTGQLGVRVSSARFKEAIKPMDKASEAILALKPVTFRYKHELDPAGIPQFGLVAEDVEKVNPDLVARDGQGKPYTVRYEAVNAMLLNEFLKGHRTVQEQQKEIDGLKAELKEQRSLIQKVSAQLELRKPSPQTVLNNH